MPLRGLHVVLAPHPALLQYIALNHTTFLIATGTCPFHSPQTQCLVSKVVLYIHLHQHTWSKWMGWYQASAELADIGPSECKRSPGPQMLYNILYMLQINMVADVTLKEIQGVYTCWIVLYNHHVNMYVMYINVPVQRNLRGYKDTF